MHKLVYQVFKTIMIAIILVFVFDMVGYLYRAASLNQRVESLMTSLQKVVMENNYLPKEQAVLYQQLFGQMAADYNAIAGQTYSATNPTQFFQGNNDAFVLAMDWNMYDDAVGVNMPNVSSARKAWNGSTWTTVATSIVHKKMGSPADYGDVQTVQVRIMVAQPTWGFMTGGAHTADDFSLDDSKNEHVVGNARFIHVFNYTYYVPCLKYVSHFE